MFRLAAIAGAAALLAPGAPAAPHGQVELPKGFQAIDVLWDLDQPVDLAFAPDGRAYVAEKSGRIWPVIDGQKAPLPLLDLSEEITNYESHGLKALALHPDFLVNGHFFLLYEVDPHHLSAFGTASYDPQKTDTHLPTIARVTRYTADPATGYTSTLPGSRRVLLGESASTGIPVVSVHESGSLAFGRDHSLLVTAGDGADNTNQTLDALLEGILTPAEAVADAFRSQLLESHAGKLLRIDPETGDGLPSNPFYDPGAPRSARSRVWALGFRNPFRMAVLPPGYASGSFTQPHAPGVPDPYALDAHPGTIVVGDVGAGDWEEINLVVEAGSNHGWPLFEGLELNPFSAPDLTENLHAPNPLFGTSVRGFGPCTSPYFFFQDLLKQESLNPVVFSNGCDPSLALRGGAPFFEHARPYIEWGHGNPVRVRAFDAAGEADELLLGDPNAPIAGQQFDGSCSVAGTWSNAGTYPPGWRGYFHADYTSGWLQLVRFNAAGEPNAIVPFADGLGALVDVEAHPQTGQLWMLTIDGELMRIRYVYGDVPPTAAGEAAPQWGPEPLVVDFAPTGSFDPEGFELGYAWDFGDGLASALESPRHVFPSVDVTEQGTPIALALALVPPQSGVGPGYDISVIGDGVYSTGGAVLLENYLTQHDQFFLKQGVDWVGYSFGAEHRFHALEWQEGMEFGDLGGWFEAAPAVEVRANGVWTPVSGLQSVPAYGGQDGEINERYALHFDPLQGDAIRLVGAPGGLGDFFSCTEMRVYAAPSTPLGVPTRYDVTLEVQDAAGGTDQTVLPIWVNNSPPSVSLSSPVQGATYDPLTTLTLPLTAFVSDAEHALAQLDCRWQITLHHNDHEHPEPVIVGCQGSYPLFPHNEQPGEVIYYSFRLDVSDPLGLTTSATHYLSPQNDCNLNGFDDALDILSGTSLDLNGNNVPDECEADCDGSGLQDPFDLFLGLASDCNGNGVPDACDIANGTSLDADGDGVPDECP